MTEKTIKERYSQLKPIMKYLYFQKSEECHGDNQELERFMTHLEKAGRLVDFTLNSRWFPKPHDMYHHLRTVYKPNPHSVQLAYEAFQITEEMAARCCYFYKKKGQLADLKLVSLTRIPGKEKMKPWIKLFEREDLRTIDTQTPFREWMTTTESGKTYAQKRNFYLYAISNLAKDLNLPKKVLITKKWFPTKHLKKQENQRG